MSRLASRRPGLWWGVLVLPALLAGLLDLLGQDEFAPAAPLDALASSAAEAEAQTLRFGWSSRGDQPALLTSLPPDAAGGRPATSATDARPGVRSPFLAGRVLDDEGRGVAAARVTLTRMRAAASAPAEVRTDAAGAFRFADVPEGRLRVQADAADCGPAWAVNVEAGTWVELRLAPAARLDVEVRGSDGALVADAQVQVQRPGFLDRKETDADGRARFERLPSGAIEVRASTSTGAAAPHLLHLAAGEPARLVCTLSPARVVRGRVVEHEGKRPVTGATVSLRGAQPDTIGTSVCTTDGDGSFELETTVAPTDGVLLVVAGDGYAEGRAPLPPAEAGTELEIALRPQGSLAGRVVDSQGRAVRGAQVTWATASADSPPAVSDGRGRFRVPLPPAPSDSGIFALLATAGSGRFGAAAVRLESEASPMLVVLRDVGSVTGTVRDPTGAPVPAALVRLEASGAHVPGLVDQPEEAWARYVGLSAQPEALSAVSDGDGLVRLASVPAGAWTVRGVHGSHDARLREPVLVGEGAEVAFDLTVGEVAPLGGRVVDAEGRPVAGARVLARPTWGSSAGHATTTAADGAYCFEALRADLRHTLTASAAGSAPAYLDDVLPGAGTLDIRLPRPARIEGRIELDGSPYAQPVEVWLVPGATQDASAESAVPVPAQRLATAQSRTASGGFQLSVPYAGPWLLCAATRDGRLAAEPIALDLAAGWGRDGLVLALRPAATVLGDTQPGAVVSVHAWSGHGLVARPLASVRVGSNGMFELRGLPPGALQLRVATPRGAATRRDVVVAPGTSTGFDVRAEPASATRNGG